MSAAAVAVSPSHPCPNMPRPEPCQHADMQDWETCRWGMRCASSRSRHPCEQNLPSMQHDQLSPGYCHPLQQTTAPIHTSGTPIFRQASKKLSTFFRDLRALSFG